MFWLSFQNHRGEQVTTEKKAWIENFQVDAEKGSGKCDLNHVIKIEEPPSIELRNWLQSDVLITLKTSQPKIILQTLEEGDIIKDIKIDDNGLPVTEEKVLGVSMMVPLIDHVD